MSISDLPSCVQSLKQLISLSNDEASDVDLKNFLDLCLLTQEKIDRSNLNTSDEEFQDAVRTCIKALEKCTLMVNELELFSSNEHIEELPTSSIRYLILPAVLGSLTLIHLHSGGLDERLKNVKISEIYFQDFLLRCKNYEVSVPSLKYFDNDVEIAERGNAPDPLDTRQRKIECFKRKKELDEKEKYFKGVLGKNCSEENTRIYYFVTLEKWVLAAVEELENIKKEKDVLKFMPQKENNTKTQKEELPKSKPLKPIIITKNEVQKRVFGLGYPSIPVLTIEDFYRQKLEKLGNANKTNSGSSLQDTALGGPSNADKEAEEVEKEQLLDKDDFEALMKARLWDDWKDENPRGSGNRYNKG